MYRYNTEWRPIIQAHLNSKWAQAATAVQRKITSRNPDNNHITSSPVLLLGSTGDNTLVHTESVERMPHIAGSEYSSVLMNHNSHDVTYSFTKQLNDDAIAIITEWLNDPSSYKVPQQEETIWVVLRKWFGSFFGR